MKSPLFSTLTSASAGAAPTGVNSKSSLTSSVMDVIELDLVLHRDRRTVAPTPADRDARVELVADVVVSHLVVAAVADPCADRSLVDAIGGVDDVVVADDVTGQRVRLVGIDARVADHHASAAQIVQPAPLDAAITAAAAEPGAVSAGVLHFAPFFLSACLLIFSFSV
jgi:hypothetical protein